MLGRLYDRGPLYVLGRRLQILYPVVPLARRQALGIAVMSYDGHLGFGLLADFDALPELETMVGDLEWAIDRLSRAAGVRTKRKRAKRSRVAKGASATVSSNGATGAAAAPARSGGASAQAE